MIVFMVKLAARHWSFCAEFSFCQVFSIFFCSKFQILFIFANSRKVFCIYSSKIGAIMVAMRRFSSKSTPKLKKIAQFSNKIFVQFSQKYTASALHRVKVLNFTALKYYSVEVENSSQNPPIWRRFVVVWSYMRPSASCLSLPYGESR